MPEQTGQKPESTVLSARGGLEVELLNFCAALKSIQMPVGDKHAVFLDAAVPEDGTSAQDLWNMVSDSSAHKVVDGIVYFSWLNPDTPLPWKQSDRTSMYSLRYTVHPEHKRPPISV